MKILVKAFVLVNSELAQEQHVLNDILKIEGVEEGFIVSGLIDLIFKIITPTQIQLEEIINKELRQNKSIRTITILIVEK